MKKAFPKTPYISVKVKPKKKVKTLSSSKAEDRAWKSFSRFIRLRDCWNDTQGLAAHCVTCKRLYKFGSTLHAGHFQPGRHKSFLFDERQVNAQCQICNRWRKGMWPEYYLFMVEKFGLKEVQFMIDTRNAIVQYKVDNYLEIERLYKEKAKEFENKLGI